MPTSHSDGDIASNQRHFDTTDGIVRSASVDFNVGYQNVIPLAVVHEKNGKDNNNVSSDDDDNFEDELLMLDDGATARSRIMPTRKTVGRPKKITTKTKGTKLPVKNRARKNRTDTDDIDVFID